MMLEEGVADTDANQRLDPQIVLASSGHESDDVASPVEELELSDDENASHSEHDGFSIVGEVEMWCIHIFTGVAHYQMDEADQELACGRAITTNLRTISRQDLDRSSAVLRKPSTVKQLTRRTSWDCFPTMAYPMSLSDHRCPILCQKRGKLSQQPFRLNMQISSTALTEESSKPSCSQPSKLRENLCHS